MIMSFLTGIFANFIFAILLFLTRRFWLQSIKEQYRVFLEKIVSKALFGEIYEEVDKTIALLNVTKSISSTNFVFIRVGNFTLNDKNYNSEIGKVIKHSKVWDYHFHLLSDTNKNTK